MTIQTRRLFIAALLLSLVFCGLATWGVVRAVAWARDLPNRIEIDIDEQALADAFQQAMVDSYHEALLRDEPEMQREVIRQLSELVAQDPAGNAWVHSEFTDDLTTLASSADAEVSAAAAELIAELAAP